MSGAKDWRNDFCRGPACCLAGCPRIPNATLAARQRRALQEADREIQRKTNEARSQRQGWGVPYRREYDSAWSQEACQDRLSIRQGCDGVMWRRVLPFSGYVALSSFLSLPPFPPHKPRIADHEIWYNTRRETEQHHALYCAVRRFRRAGGGWAGLEHCLCIYSKTYTERSDPFVPRFWTS